MALSTTAICKTFVKRHAPLLHAAVIFFSLSAAPVSHAAVWTGAAGDNDWQTPGNWESGISPGAGDKADFSAASGSVVHISEPAEAASLLLPASELIFIGEELRLTSANAVSFAGGGSVCFSNAVVFANPQTTQVQAQSSTVTFAGAVSVAGLFDIRGGKEARMTVGGPFSATGGVRAEIRQITVSAPFSSPFLTLTGSEKYYDWTPGLALRPRDGDTEPLLDSGMELRDGGYGWNLDLAGPDSRTATERIASAELGFAAPHWIWLSGGAVLQIGEFKRKPGGIVLFSPSGGSKLVPDGASNDGGVYKPWLLVSSGGAYELSHVAEDGSIDSAVPWQTMPMSKTDANTPYQLPGGSFEQITSNAVSALRLNGASALDLAGHGLSVRHGFFQFVSGETKRIDANGGGTLHFGGGDLILRVEANTQITAPIAHDGSSQPEIPPSIIIPRHWGGVTISGEDHVGEWYGLYSEGGNVSIDLGGPSDRTFSGPVVGKFFLTKTGTGTVRFNGPRYTPDGGWYYALNVREGRVIAANSASFWTVKLLGGEYLFDGPSVQGEIDRSDGTVFGGIGGFTENRVNNAVRFNSTQTLALGLDGKTGVFTITTQAYRDLEFQDGCTIRATVSPEEISSLRRLGNKNWGYTKFPGSGGTVRLLLEPTSDKLVLYQPSREYTFAHFEQDTPSGTDCSWTVESARPKLLDASQAKVIYRDKSFIVTGLRTAAFPTLLIFR